MGLNLYSLEKEYIREFRENVREDVGRMPSTSPSPKTLWESLLSLLNKIAGGAPSEFPYTVYRFQHSPHDPPRFLRGKCGRFGGSFYSLHVQF